MHKTATVDAMFSPYTYIYPPSKTIFLQTKQKRKEEKREKENKKMKVANTKLFVLVLCLAVCVGMCRPWGDEVVEDTKVKAEEAKDGAAAAAKDAKEKTESFAGWAYDKITQ